MASSYALPASAMTHGHHGHNHQHTHSSSPSRQSQYSANTPRVMRQERSSGALHTQTQSESHSHHAHTHNHSHSYEGVLSRSPYLPTPPSSDGLPPISGPFDKPVYELSPAISQSQPFKALTDHHGHVYVASIEPRSRFTSFLLPFVLQWPLLHTVLADKDSRRIFYFMRSAMFSRATEPLLSH